MQTRSRPRCAKALAALLGVSSACARRSEAPPEAPPAAPTQAPDRPVDTAAREPFAELLMRSEDITEASRFPFVELRNQPHRIYERFERDPDAYATRCRATFDRIGHRYFRIRHRSGDGLFVEAVVAVPPGFDPDDTYPTVIFNRGNWGEGRRFTFCFTGAYEMWTRRGYVVFGPQYRGNNGGEGVDEWGGDDVLDVTSVLDIAKTLPFVDTNNVFMYGNSRGGMMTYMAIRAGAEVNAAIVNCGVASVQPPLRDDIVARVLPPDIEDSRRAAEYRERSAVAWAEELDVPLLIIHGELDPGVPVETVHRLQAELRKGTTPHEVLIYPGAGHCGEGYPDSFTDDVFDWVERFSR